MEVTEEMRLREFFGELDCEIMAEERERVVGSDPRRSDEEENSSLKAKSVKYV